DARFPSVDELNSALKSAAKIETRTLDATAAWPVLGADSAALTLAAEVARLSPGQGLAIVGPRRSGRTTLAHRLSWSLGVGGGPVASIEPSRDAMITSKEVVDLELEDAKTTEDLIVIVDDLADL